MNEAVLTVGIYRLTGQPKHIDDVDRGLNCQCICLDCEERLIANKGRSKAHHFSHQSNIECQGEGNLHRMAKQILIEKKQIYVPHFATKNPVKVSFISGREEVTKGDIRIDCLMIAVDSNNDERELAVEVKVTHAVDAQKRRAFENLSLAAVELDLSYLLSEDQSPTQEEIEKAICGNHENVRWLFNERLNTLVSHLEKYTTKELSLRKIRKERGNELRSIREKSMSNSAASYDKKSLRRREYFLDREMVRLTRELEKVEGDRKEFRKQYKNVPRKPEVISDDISWEEVG